MNHALQALSYYKIFGYPTGLGALLVHKRAVPLLMKRKRYFGGGTVAVSVAEEDFFRLASFSIIKRISNWFSCVKSVCWLNKTGGCSASSLKHRRNGVALQR